MKKLLAVLLTAALFLVPINAIAAVKAGDTCKKVGTTATANGKKFTCVKSGKKLVWNKGVAIPKPKPVEVSTPAPIPSPTVTVAPTPTPTPEKPFEPVTLENLDIRQVSSLAFKKVVATLEGKKDLDFEIKILADPKLDPNWIESEKSDIKLAAKFWSSEFSPIKVTFLYWLTYSADSIAWAQKIYDEAKGSYNLGSQIIDQNRTFCQSASGADFATGPAENRVHNYFVHTCAGEREIQHKFKIIHEYTHLFQTKYHVPQNAPAWVTEGSADYYGVALGLMTQMNGVDVKHRSGLAKYHLRNLINFSEFEFVELMRSQENPSADPQVAYYLGGIATEALIAVYGHETFVKFLKSFTNMKDPLISPERSPSTYKQNFQNAFGITTDDFYKKLYPYAVGMTKKFLVEP